jgi:peptidoglycan/xylan/chitin deacetylase (PgdA/CDA1 family)
MLFPRIDRLATLYCVSPALRFIPREKNLRISILMYHHISAEAEPNLGPYYRLNTPPSLFEKHLSLLRQVDCTVLSLSDALVMLRTPGAKGNFAVITFDDGYESVYTEAFPLLQQFGFPATVFLPTDYISQSRSTFNGIPCLTWSEVKAMAAHEVSFGSHTKSHPKLLYCAWDKITDELSRSKKVIESELGTNIDSFAYPYAFPQNHTAFITRLQDELHMNGYKSCSTTKIGRAALGDNLFELKRLPANCCDDSQLFLAKLDGAYDWIATAQALRKIIKGIDNR